MAGIKNRSARSKKPDAAGAFATIRHQNNMRSTREQIVFLVVFVMFVLISINVDRNSAVRDPAQTTMLDRGWQLETGETVNLEEIPWANTRL